MSHEALSPQQFPRHAAPRGFKPEEGQCFLNASECAGWKGSRYVEGHAKGPGDKEWTEHAWLKMPDKSIVDPTWKDTGPGFEYRERKIR